jgi:hypothetical protein
VQKSKGTHTAFSKKLKSALFVSLALVLQAANMYFCLSVEAAPFGAQKKTTDKVDL